MPPSDAQRPAKVRADDVPTSLTGSPPPTLPTAPEPAAALGSAIGRYAVIEEVGRGGMGTVVRAYDPKLRREVALKRLAPHALGTEGEARLVREAQAMAKLSHPNVVAIYDVEAGDEGVTIVMEYVAGETLRDWLRERSRPWLEIVALFRRAGEGVAAAHRAGLVHRDFKPGNVLVTSDGRVKVTDFGLAKLAGSPSTASRDELEPLVDPTPSQSGAWLPDEGTTLTRADVVMGTPPFMAPEQHLGRDPDARADQYAFCVALWMALNRASPFRGEGAALLEAKQEGPPAWPKGSDVPRPIAVAIERGLAPEPDARWASMEDLLAALAHDPSVRRRRRLTLLAGGGALTLALALPLFMTAGRTDPCTGARAQLDVIWDDARREEIPAGLIATGVPYAEATAERVKAHLDDYANAWVAQHTDACEATAVRGEQSTTLLDLRMTCLQHAKLRLTATIEVLAQPDTEVVTRAVALVRGLPSVAHCSDSASLQSESPPPAEPEVAAAVEAQQGELARGRALVGVGKYAEGAQIAEAIEAAALALDFGPLVADAKSFRGATATKLGKYDEAHALLEDALELALAHRESLAVEIAADLVLVTADRLGRPDEARAWASVAMGLAQARDPGGELEALANGALGSVRIAEGRYEDALAAFQRAEAIYERSFGPDDPRVAETNASLARCLKALGRYREAEVAARRGYEIIAIVHGPEHPRVAGAIETIAGVLLDQGKIAEAETELRKVAALRKRALGSGHPLVAATLDNLAGVLAREGKLEEAETMAREAFRTAEASLGPDNPEMALFHANIGTVLADAGKPQESLGHLRRSLEIAERTFAPGHPSTVVPLENLGELLLELGERDEALPLLERAWELATTSEAPPMVVARCGIRLADALASEPDTLERALEIARAARARAVSAGLDADGELVAQIDDWLRAHVRAGATKRGD